jgi:YVTN family beta-propeller protein
VLLLNNIFLVLPALLVFAISSSLLAFAQNEGEVQIVPIGSSALDIEIIDGLVYVTNPAEGRISVIDAESKQVVDTIPAPIGVLFIEIAKEKNKLYATVEGQNKVIVYDLQTYQQQSEIDLGDQQIVRFSKADKPYGEREYVYFATSGVGLAYNSNNKMLYVIHSEINSVKVINTDTNLVVGSIPVGITPVQIVIDETTNTAYVTNWESNNLTIINLDAHQVAGTLHTGFVPTRMLIDQENRMMYVSHHASPQVTAVDLETNTVSKTIPLKAPTHALVLDPEAKLLHVTYRPESGFTGAATLHRVEFIDVNTNSLVSGIDIPANPYQLRIDDNNQLFGTVIRDGSVFSVNLSANPQYQEIVSKAQEGDFASGGCLIATAAYGSELAPQVQLLREVRDNVLLDTNSGVSFMSGFNTIYYTFSPTVADWQRESPMFQQAVRAVIIPMLSTLTILNFVDIDSEQEMLGYGIGIILLNIGMYLIAPAIVIIKIKSRFFS